MALARRNMLDQPYAFVIGTPSAALGKSMAEVRARTHTHAHTRTHKHATIHTHAPTHTDTATHRKSDGCLYVSACFT